MSAKTKIVVLHMKELIYTAIFVGLGILLIILLLYMFLPKEKESSVETAKYVPGVYTSTITFQDQTMDVQVVVEENQIHSTVTTMYPLMETTMEQVRDQILENQSLENITYTTENQYTTTVLVNAVKEALDKAVVEEDGTQTLKEEQTTESSPTTGEVQSTESSPTTKENSSTESSQTMNVESGNENNPTT